MSLLDPTWQWTLRRPFSCSGVGIHSGEQVSIQVLPAPAHHGIAFSRVDLPGRPCVPALAEYVADVTLSTSLSRGRAGVRTVEHLLAALFGMGVSNALVAVAGDEIPALDGSAREFAREIAEAGRVALPAERRRLDLPADAAVELGDRWIRCRPAEDFSVTYEVDYGHPLAGPQLWDGTVDAKVFGRELAPARSFCLLADAERMRAAGMARGGSFANAVVVLPDGYSSPLRFPDEFVRHKVVDLLGDLALAGADWRGRISAFRAGHSLHVQLATRLRQVVRAAGLQRATSEEAYAS